MTARELPKPRAAEDASRLRILLLWMLVILLVGVSVALVFLRIFIAQERSLTAVENGFIDGFLWVSALAVGLAGSYIYSLYQAKAEVQALARPAIRRVLELQRSAQVMIQSIHGGSGIRGSSDDQGLALALELHLGQLGAAVADWREVLPTSLVNQIVQEEKSPGDDSRMTWDEFIQVLNSLFDQIDRSDARGGFRPSVVVGTYPAGGMIAYLLWIRFGRRIRVLLAPDVNRMITPEASARFAASLEEAVGDVVDGRVLIADASLKSGRTLLRTRLLCEESVAGFAKAPRIASLAVLKVPLAAPSSAEADYVGITRDTALPFAES